MDNKLIEHRTVINPETHVIINNTFPKKINGIDNTIIKRFYRLLLDKYNQPKGEVENVKMTRAKFELTKLLNRNSYLFDNIVDAHRRSLD